MMKYPALTRVLSIALVVLCLTMAAAGALGLNQAQRDRRLCFEDMERLRGRVEEYQALAAKLEGRESGDTLSERLDEQTQSHEEESAQHRSELGTFTATQFGLEAGLDAIDQAEAQFASLKGLFEKGMASVKKGMGEIDTVLSSLWTLYDTAAPVLDSAHAHLDTVRGIGASLDSGEQLSYAQVAAAYDELLRIADETSATAETLRGLEPTLDALAGVDVGAITDMVTDMQDIAGSLGSFGDIPLDGYADFNVDFDFDMGQITQYKNSYDQIWSAVKQGLALYDTARANTEAGLQELTGLSMADLRAQAQAARDELAARGDEPLDPAESEAVLTVWRSIRGAVLQGLSAAESGLRELDGYVGQIGSALSTFQTQIDGLKSILGKAAEMIAAAEQAMYDARALIWQQMGLQREKEEELWERKDRLDQDALALQQLSDEAETQEEMEKRQQTLRMNLLGRDGIKERSDAGEELGSAAQAYLDDTLREAEETYARRRVACLLMLFGALYSLLGVPAAFEAVRSRLLVSLPLLHCLGCAAGAVQILWKLGRGLSYSALAVMVFALLQLLVIRPRKKKKRSA